MRVKSLFKMFSRTPKVKVPDIKIKRVKKVYDVDGVLREETIESNAYIDGDKLDMYFKKMDEIFARIDEGLREK
jgi:hypothetical protein